MASVKDIAKAAQVEVQIIGTHDFDVTGPSPFSEIVPGKMTFLKAVPTDKTAAIRSLKGCVALVSREVAEFLGDGDYSLIVVKNPRLAFMRAVGQLFALPDPLPGAHPTALISRTAEIDATASIGAYCVIGDHCSIGANTILFPHVTVYSHVRIGDNVRINSGTVIGADGFGFEYNEMGELEKFPHIGGVVIEDDVEIGSNTSIDRGTLGNTRIRQRARIDNLVHVAHNVDIGEDAAVIANTMLGGSVKVARGAWIAPSATIKNQVSIGANSMVGLGAVVVKTVLDRSTVMGAPAQLDLDFKAERSIIKELVNERK